VLGDYNWGSYSEITTINIPFNSDSSCSHEDLNNNFAGELVP
jgi:hypothetical protein